MVNKICDLKITNKIKKDSNVEEEAEEKTFEIKLKDSEANNPVKYEIKPYISDFIFLLIKELILRI